MVAHTHLDMLLALPALAALPDTLRGVLRDAATGAVPVSGAGAAEVMEPPDAASQALLVDTLALLSRLHVDGETLVATVLHDMPAWATRVRQGASPVNPSLVALLDGQAAAAQVWALHADEDRHGSQEGLRRLLLAMVRDLRVVPILLARQLAQLRAAASLPEASRRALARLTRDIHAPLANRLGIWQLKWELEDLAFRHLEPLTYQRIARLLDDTRAGRERYIEQVRVALGSALATHGIRADVAGRPKHIYSIWKKMQKKDVPIGGLYDLRAVRVLVDDVQACYAALGAVHAAWSPVPGEFDDYIARPKHNDYRSLHTAVVGPGGKTLEVQIRTHEMHAQAELGVAAHWRYKESGGSQRSGAGEAAVTRKIEWMRRLLDAHGEGEDAALAGGFGAELVEDRIYALTPRGEVIDLPRGATPLDFAYHVHTEVGHRCRGAKVDGRIVPLDHVLASGDRVEILTAKTGEPRRDWLLASNGFLASARSRDKVRAWFHRLDRARNLQAGRELLERELRRVGMLAVDPAPALRRFNADSLDDLHVQVALGDVGPHQVARALLEHQRAAQRAADPDHPSPMVLPRPPRGGRTGTRASEFTVVGVGNLLVQVARCCAPLPGEAVGGYLTQARGVTVHRADCAAFARMAALHPQRAVPVEWGGAGSGHEADIRIEATDRKHLLRDVTNLVAQQEAHVMAISGGTRGGPAVRLRLRVRVRDFGQLSRLLGRLEGIAGVERAHRA